MRGNVLWTPQRVAYTALLMGWSELTNLTERFETTREFLEMQCKHWKLGASYDGWMTALCRESPRLIPHVIGRLRRQMMAMENYRLLDRWIGIGADGSDSACPRTEANQAAMNGAGQHDGMPQLLMTTLYHLHLGLPWAFRVGSTTGSERAHLREMIGELPEDAILVADAGFCGYDLIRHLMRENQHFLLRVGGNAHLLSELGCEAEIEGQTVYLWPVDRQHAKEPSLKLRLVVVKDEDKQPVYLVTSVLDENALTDQEASELYRARWGVEVFYRTTKQTMERRAVRGRTPEHCYAEMSWNLLSVWLLGLTTTRALAAAGHAPSAWSPAAARTAVRRVLRGLSPKPRSRASLQTVLSCCLKDAYPRHRPKASRNYPRKKRQKPPGPPKIKSPTEKQRLLAKQLTPINLNT